jgi:hypothetical protein
MSGVAESHVAFVLVTLIAAVLPVDNCPEEIPAERVGSGQRRS